MRFLFVSAQLPGHLDWGGYLKTAIELQARGHEVLWASGKAVKPLLDRAQINLHELSETGWRWPPPPPLSPDPSLEPQALHELHAERALDQWLDVSRVSAATTELLDLLATYRPDLVLGENFMSAAAIAADLVQIPFVVVGWPAFQAQTTDKTQTIAMLGRERLTRLLTHFNASGLNWTQEGPPALLSPHLHLSYWSPSWFQNISLLKQTLHVGVKAPNPESVVPSRASTALLNAESIAEKPWVFITLGTSFGQDPNFFVAATHAVARLDVVPIVAIAQPLSQEELTSLRARLSPATILFNQIQFALILPMMSAAIHHGGAGTTHALVTHAVPQIVVPHAADQIHQAHGVTRSGVGVGIRPQNVTIDALEQMLVEMMAEDSPFQQNAKKVQSEFATLGGIERGANLLAKIVSG
ncbi:glycosyltransferase [Chloroflexi bacterium TSY]|nr:glycosyltransferase [Chloroflexi bacterium TSY]